MELNVSTLVRSLQVCLQVTLDDVDHIILNSAAEQAPGEIYNEGGFENRTGGILQGERYYTDGRLCSRLP